MSIKAGKELISQIITPFYERTTVRYESRFAGLPQEDLSLSYGLGPAGYDVRIEFDAEGSLRECHLLAGCFMLASTIEKFTMPDNIAGRVYDKSSWARRGLAVQNTFIEPGWQGFLTLELSNHSNHDIVLLRGMPIAMIVFEEVENGFAYEGKYQDQTRGPNVAR